MPVLRDKIPSSSEIPVGRIYTPNGSSNPSAYTNTTAAKSLWKNALAKARQTRSARPPTIVSTGETEPESAGQLIKADNLRTVVLRSVGTKCAFEKFKKCLDTSRSNHTERISRDKSAKSGMKKNSSYSELQREGGRVDSGKYDGTPDLITGGVTDPPDGLSVRNPKKTLIFEGMLTDDLPPLNSKIVRIFTSSTFTGWFTLVVLA